MFTWNFATKEKDVGIDVDGWIGTIHLDGTVALLKKDEKPTHKGGDGSTHITTLGSKTVK